MKWFLYGKIAGEIPCAAFERKDGTISMYIVTTNPTVSHCILNAERFRHQTNFQNIPRAVPWEYLQ